MTNNHFCNFFFLQNLASGALLAKNSVEDSDERCKGMHLGLVSSGRQDLKVCVQRFETGLS